MKYETVSYRVGGATMRKDGQSCHITSRRTRLSAEREHELFEAVLDVLRDVGYEALTMDAVAARAHSSKATLYRQWKTKPELVATAVRHSKPVRAATVDTGSLRGDLVWLADMVCHSADKDTALIRALAHAQHSNEELLHAMRQVIVEPEVEAFRNLLSRAIQRGELAEGVPGTDFALHMLLGAVLTRPLVEGKPVDHEYLVRYIDAVVLPALRMA